MTYTAEQVKEMAMGKGLPCEISKRKGISIVSPASTLESLCLYREWSHYIRDDIQVFWPNYFRCDVTAMTEAGIKWLGTPYTRTYERQEWLQAERDAKAAGLKVRAA